jgi:hypothetical protein
MHREEAQTWVADHHQLWTKLCLFAFHGQNKREKPLSANRYGRRKALQRTVCVTKLLIAPVVTLPSRCVNLVLDEFGNIT